jgi:hypothetical protein
VQLGKREGYAIAFQVGMVQVLFAVFQGQRGGLSGLLTVVDLSQQIEINKLICCNDNLLPSEQPIEGLYYGIRFSKKTFHDAGPRYLIQKMDEWKNNPALLMSIANYVGFGEHSVHTLAGGAVSPR